MAGALALPREVDLFTPVDSINLGPPVVGDVSERSKNVLGSLYMKAKGTVTKALQKYGLKPQKPVPLHVEEMRPEDGGLVNGYTDWQGGRSGFTKVVLNKYIVPFNNRFDELMEKWSSSESRFKRYISRKVGRWADNVYKTLVHEVLHGETQIKPGFADSLGRETEYFFTPGGNASIRERDFYKDLAREVFTASLEGANEAARRQVTDGMGTRAVESATANPRETYDVYTHLAAKALRKMGIEEPMELYSRYQEYKGVVRDYVRNFWQAVRDHMNLKQPAYAYATA